MYSVIEENRAWINDVWSKIDEKLSLVCIRSREKIPFTAIDGVHDDMREEIDWWTNGFWSGMMWLMYKATENAEYKKTAIRAGELLNKAMEKYETLHHDVGFMWHLSAGADYRITGNLSSRNINLFAAATLASRFNINGRFIRAWNGKENKGWTIVDSLMNIPLLYWAAKELDEENFKNIAIAHADMTIRDHIRPDGSIRHIVEHDLITGDLVKVYAGQGYSEYSCWTRGAAWVIYGMILSYIHTKENRYLEAARLTADYFIENAKITNYKIPVDFNQPPEPMYYDSTAGVCAACGILEIAKYVSDVEAKNYTQAAISILKATDENFCCYDKDKDFIVGMGTGSYPHNDTKNLHIPIIYGDFFFVEAICKLKGHDFLIW